MIERVKIKCDDCKFVEDCVDYGWEGCKKFTQKASEAQTNEEWLRTATTEQLAEWLIEATQHCFECGLNVNNSVLCPFKECIDKDYAVEWLKEKHDEM